jgi:hypothetical protein
MDLELALFDFIEQFPAERRAQIHQQFFGAVDDIVNTYLDQAPASEALQMALRDQQDFESCYGNDRHFDLLDAFVRHTLYFKTLH